MTLPAETNEYWFNRKLRQLRYKKAIEQWWTGHSIDAYSWMHREFKRLGLHMLDGLPEEKQEQFVQRLESASVGPFARLHKESRECGDPK